MEFEASVLDHPDSECIFFNRLYNLDLNSLSHGAEIIGNNPCKLEKYQIFARFFANERSYNIAFSFRFSLVGQQFPLLAIIGKQV